MLGCGGGMMENLSVYLLSVIPDVWVPCVDHSLIVSLHETATSKNWKNKYDIFKKFSLNTPHRRRTVKKTMLQLSKSRWGCIFPLSQSSAFSVRQVEGLQKLASRRVG